MIDYNNNKFAFADAGLFTLNNATYSGYYNVLSGSAYSGKQFDSQSQLLQSTFVIESDVALSSYFKDRIYSSSLQLPYSFSDIEIPPGETLNARTFNDRLYKIYQNFLYTYTKCFMPYSFDPYNVTSVAATRFNGFAWQTQYKTVDFESVPVGIGAVGFDASSKFLVSPYSRDSSKYVLMAAFPGSSAINSKLFFIDLGDPSVNFQNIPAAQGIFEYDYIDTPNNKYKSITSITLMNNWLFVCDQSNNQVYKYNVSDLLNQDRLQNYKRVYVESIGGIGALADNSKFNAPDKVYAFDAINKLFVSDAGNKCIKVYDSNFVHQKTLSYPRNSNYTTQSIAFYEPQQLIYVMVYDASQDSYFFNVYSASLDIVDTIQIDIERALIGGTRKELLKEAYFSLNNSNVLYIVGEQFIYKVYLNTNQQFSKWLPYVLSNAQNKQTPDAGYKDITIINSNNDYDVVFAFGNALSADFTGNMDRIWYTQDKVTLNSVVSDKVVNFYTLENFGINDNEFLQGFVINKELFKMTYNIFTLRNLIRGKFAIKFDVANNIVADDYAPFTDAQVDLLKVNYNENMFVHENENMQSPDAINRVFEKVYNIQASLLQVVNAVYTNIAFSNTPGTTAVAL